MHCQYVGVGAGGYTHMATAHCGHCGPGSVVSTATVLYFTARYINPLRAPGCFNVLCFCRHGAFMHCASSLEVYQMLECSTGESLARAAFVYHDDKRHSALTL